jgi:hypothetical protein
MLVVSAGVGRPPGSDVLGALPCTEAYARAAEVTGGQGEVKMRAIHVGCRTFRRAESPWPAVGRHAEDPLNRQE